MYRYREAISMSSERATTHDSYRPELSYTISTGLLRVASQSFTPYETFVRAYE
jgi:hypothetical protein